MNETHENPSKQETMMNELMITNKGQYTRVALNNLFRRIEDAQETMDRRGLMTTLYAQMAEVRRAARKVKYLVDPMDDEKRRLTQNLHAAIGLCKGAIEEVEQSGIDSDSLEALLEQAYALVPAIEEYVLGKEQTNARICILLGQH